MGAVNIDPVNIDGTEYYTITEFSSLVHRSANRIYNLIYTGNKERKLRAKKVHNVWYVQASELSEYPWTAPGPDKRSPK